MGLTSHKVLALSALVSLLMVAGTVRLWPRLARGGWAAVLGRIATILGTQLAVVCTLALIANNYGSFYSSWSDLLGTNQDGSVTIRDKFTGDGKQSGVQTLGKEHVHGGNTVTREPSVVGRLERVRIPGAGTGLSTEGYVYLPPQYFQPAYADEKFPAMVAITGFPGIAKNLITNLNYPGTELRLIGEGRMKPTVLVLMRPSPVLPRDTECEDVPRGPQAETYFTRDVPSAVRASYRVSEDPRGWAVMGDSTGGYCALKFAIKHPDAFAAAVSLSGYYKADNDVDTGDLFGGEQGRREAADLVWWLAHHPQPRISVLVGGTRKGDGDYYQATKAFIDAVQRPMNVSWIMLDNGGHNFNTWNRMLPASMAWLSDHLAGPAAAAPAQAEPAAL
ncbi:alpha/beta hydrolase-fold protein [Kitasatospora cystarginea]|uniref:Alpha/beta hydrolase-fold protein n=1 Tax=Kitasatospora cystarginea TaxID=58350 RepID=A0ABN3EX92_9ACTN